MPMCGCAVGAGVPFVMVSLASYPRIDPGRLAVFSARVMRLLRTQLRFGGVIISDDMGAAKAVAERVPGHARHRLPRGRR